jgi:hypothetical protein
MTIGNHDAIRRGRAPALVTATMIMVVATALSGCAPAALSSARIKLQAGNYLAARQDLLALRAQQDKLSPEQRREVKDDLCMTDFMIGRPTLSLREQREVCADAAAEPGSRSADFLARIDQATAASDVEAVEHAIRTGDLAGAESAAADYASTPGADPAKLAGWSRRMWSMVDSQQPRAPHARKQKAAVARAIAGLKKEHRVVRAMSDAEFHKWIVETATVQGQPFIINPHFHDGVLRLTVPAHARHAAALNLDKFAKINDAAVARCGCNARTNVSVGAGAFPAYVARLDPQEERSEVLILLSGESIGPRVSMR